MGGAVESDRYGRGLAMSDDGRIIAIGAPFSDDEGNQSGHTKIFQWDGADWTQLGPTISGDTDSLQEGLNVELNAAGTIVACAAPSATTLNGAASGRVRLFSWEATTETWDQLGSNIDGEGELDYSGTSIDLSADGFTVAIGSALNADNGAVYPDGHGHVRVFIYDGADWMQQGVDLDGDSAGDAFGASVALSADGHTLAVGAIEAVAGIVRVYTWTDSAWVPVGADIVGVDAGDKLGAGLDLSADGLTLAVGAPYQDGGGHVQIYTLVQGTWTLQGADLEYVTANDKFGERLALSADGSTVVVGAPNNPTVFGSAGEMRVFRWIAETGTWTQQGSSVYGQALFDNLGEAVVISGNGAIAAVGAGGYDGFFLNAGHVQAFHY
jgi:hypothetical protein